ncbi:lysozyme inhibitor LprI family protein [Nocardia sp. NBC_00511]|uniref:lysozyme inhibitor LprI family protein n=1 Tax=Nocardia sp. NBC_00511 TaxID=2903591 RepID=UPI0030E55E58
MFEPIRGDYLPPQGQRGRSMGRAVAIGLAAAVVGGAATVGGLYFAGVIGDKDKSAAVATSVAPAAIPASPSTSTAAVSGYVPIVEPNSKDKQAAKRQPGAGTCSATASSTADMEHCYDLQTEDVDAQIDVAQKAKFDQATATDRQAILDDDSAWLTARPTVCGAMPKTGGTIDGINFAACTLTESQARLIAAEGTNAPAVKLPLLTPKHVVETGTYTTPKGSRISVVEKSEVQAGATTCWTVIGGYAGFTVNTDQFTYATPSGTITGTPSDPTDSNGHRVDTGELYKFCLRYPDALPDLDGGNMTYSPGSPAALWSVKNK